jgi:hypothetical protein
VNRPYNLLLYLLVWFEEWSGLVHHHLIPHKHKVGTKRGMGSSLARDHELVGRFYGFHL